MITECPPASALFDDELPQDTADLDVQMSNETPEAKPIPPSAQPQMLPVSHLPPIPHPLSPPSLPSRIVEHVIPERAVTPVPSSIVEPEPEPETRTGVEAEQPAAAAAPQKVKLSLQAWKMKKQAEKREQQRAGNAQAQAEGRGVEVGNVNGGGSTQASPMSVISVLGVGEEQQQQGGVMEVESSPVESCKAYVVGMIRPSTATTTTTTTITTTTTTSAAPVVKLELNGYHGPPLLLPQTRVAKQEVIE